MTTDPARPFGRVLSAMVTPLTEDGTVDLAGTQELAAHLVDRCAHDGLVIAGTTGESPTLSDAEQRSVLEVVLDAVGDRATVVAGVGTNDTAHSIEKARDAERLGAHGLHGRHAVLQQAAAVRAAAALHLGGRQHRPAGDAVRHPAAHRSSRSRSRHSSVRAEHPRIVAVKDAKGDLGAVAWTLARTDLAYYSGEDMLNLPLLALGAVGVVSVVGHVVGPRLAELIAAVESGDLVKARAVNESLLPIYTGIFRTQGVILVKAALRELGLPAGPVRPPLIDATPEEIAQLRLDLVAGGISL